MVEQWLLLVLLVNFFREMESIISYLERVKVFFIANQVEDDSKASVLLSLLGSKVYGVLRNIMSPNRPQDQLFEDLKRELKGHFAPKPLVIGERFYFHKWNQTPTESVSDYVAELQRLASTCKFGEYLQDASRHRFVCGLVHNGTQKQLLSEPDLTFE